MTGTKKAGALLLSMLFLTPLSGLSAAGAQESFVIPTDSVWTYSYNETIKEPGSIDLDIGGTWKYMCIGMVDIVVRGNESQVLEFYSSVKANVSGTIWQTNPFGYPWTISVVGKLKITTHEYYNLSSGVIIRTLADYLLDVRDGTAITATTLIYYEEHNETNYTEVSVSPEGFSIDPDFGNLDPGTSWAREYSGFSNTTGVAGTKPFSYSYELSRTTNFTYVGQETVTVPAGSFDCNRISYKHEGTNVTEWYSPKIENNAKVVSSAQGDEVTNILLSYDLEYETIGGTGETKLDPLILGVTLVIVLAAILATVALYMWKKRPPDQPGNP